MTAARPAKKKESTKIVSRKTATKASSGFTPAKESKKGTINKVSRIVIRYNVGFNNNLYIRGNGPGMSWEKGVLMKNVGPDEWVWETSQAFSDCEFKVLVNDQNYEGGENHRLSKGDLVEYTPSFY